MKKIQFSFLFAILLALTACASNRDIVKTACDGDVLVETCAFGLYGQYVVLTEQAAALSEDPRTPDNVKAAIKAVDAKGYPTVKVMRDVALDVQAARTAYASGVGTVGKLAVVATQLEMWIAKAVGYKEALTHIVEGEK